MLEPEAVEDAVAPFPPVGVACVLDDGRDAAPGAADLHLLSAPRVRRPRDPERLVAADAGAGTSPLDLPDREPPRVRRAMMQERAGPLVHEVRARHEILFTARRVLFRGIGPRAAA